MKRRSLFAGVLAAFAPTVPVAAAPKRMTANELFAEAEAMVREAGYTTINTDITYRELGEAAAKGMNSLVNKSI